MNLAPLHHPAEDTLLRHAAGTLPPGRSLVVAVHLPFCPDCRAVVRLGEAMGGVLLADLPAAELGPDSLNRTLARLDAPVGQGTLTPEPIALGQGVPLPEALRGLVRPKWRWLAPGVSRITVDVPGRRGASTAREYAYLLRVAPGTSLPGHGHHGWEATCVLSGSFTNATGMYGPGDVAETDVGLMHQPVAGTDEACICLIAWEGRLRMRGLLARLVQPLLGV
jgi:putative transcriptional regulator